MCIRDSGKTEGVGERGASSAVAARKRGNKSFDATPEINRQAQDCAELDDDGIHLPVTVGQADVQEQFGDAQVRRRADREELGETFDNAKDERQQVVVQSSSAESLREQYRRKSIGRGRLRDCLLYTSRCV